MRVSRLLAAAAWLSVPAAVLGDSPAFTLDVEGSDVGKEIALTRPANGFIPLQLIYSGPAPAQGQPLRTVQASASVFRTDQDSVSPALVAKCDPVAKKEQTLTLTVPATSVVPVCLWVPELTMPAKYTGSVVLLSEGMAPAVKKFGISNPGVQQGTLVLNQQAVAMQVTRPFWPWGKSLDAACTVVVREKSGKTAIQGLTARLEPGAKGPGGFDLKNVQFALNGKPADLTVWNGPAGDAAGQRTIPVGGQSQVTLTMRDLEPGEYTATFRFSGVNSTEDDAQKLTLTMNVRDSVWRALLWLILAVAVSFLASKVLVSQRRRLDLEQKIRSMRPSWFSRLPQVPPVVWVQAVLHQAGRLSSRFWLTSPDLIEARVNTVKSMLEILAMVQSVRDQLEAKLDWFIMRRARLMLDRLVSRLGTSALDDKAMEGIKGGLAKFGDWLDDARFPGIFWENVQPNLRTLESDIGKGPLPEAGKEMMQELRSAIQTALEHPPATAEEVCEIYKKYARLRILWDLRKDDDALAQCLGCADLREFFRLSDKRDWERLKSAAIGGQILEVHLPPVTDPDGLEAYDPLQFSVHCTDGHLGGTYLFQHRVEYLWHFLLTPPPSRMRKRLGMRPRESMTLEPRSLGPSVVQYFPRAGEVTVFVELMHEGERIAGPKSAPLKLQASRDFGALGAFEKVEWVSWLIAAGVAVATGLATFYYKAATFGTFQDYLTLFLWGAGVDQGRSFLQQLQATSSANTQAAPPASAAK